MIVPDLASRMYLSEEAQQYVRATGPEHDEVILTEVDAEEVAMAEAFFERAGVADRAVFERGDAMEIGNRYDGPFDVVLIDHRKDHYADAFEAIRQELPVGAAIVADNAMHGAVSLTDLLPYFESGADLPDDTNTRGVAEYIETVRAAQDFHTVVLPVGNGLALTTRERR